MQQGHVPGRRRPVEGGDLVQAADGAEGEIHPRVLDVPAHRDCLAFHLADQFTVEVQGSDGDRLARAEVLEREHHMVPLAGLPATPGARTSGASGSLSATAFWAAGRAVNAPNRRWRGLASLQSIHRAPLSQPFGVTCTDPFGRSRSSSRGRKGFHSITL